MYKIGITGSIGTGKTTIASMFAKYNIPVFDADNEIKELLKQEVIKKRLRDIWPNILKTNDVNKQKLKSIIFSNKEEKEKLEKLLYPYLKLQQKKFENRNQRKKILVYDVPLIYETKTEKNYNLILLANCDTILQKNRVLKRDNISRRLFKNITETQLSFNEKIKFNPKIINTDKLKLFILVQVFLLIIKILIKLKIKEWNKKES